MFDWENKLKELNDYNIAFEIKQGYYHISLVFDEGWDVLIPDNENIYVEQRNGVYHYIALIGSVSIEELFKAINETIEYNMDMQRKLQLFKEKTIELQEIFANESLETLQTIKFIYGEQAETKTSTEKKKRGRKPKAKSKETKKKQEVKNEQENNLDITVPEQSNDELIQSEMPKYDYDTEEEVVIPVDNEFMEEMERP